MKPISGNPDDLPEVLKPSEIARVHRIGIRTVHSHLENGSYVGGHHIEIKKGFENGGAYRIGNVWRIPREAWLDYLRRRNRDTLREIAEQQDTERKRQRRELKRMRAESN